MLPRGGAPHACGVLPTACGVRLPSWTWPVSSWLAVSPTEGMERSFSDGYVTFFPGTAAFWQNWGLRFSPRRQIPATTLPSYDDGFLFAMGVQIRRLHRQSVSNLSRAVENFQDAITDQALVMTGSAISGFQFDSAIASGTIGTGHIAFFHMTIMRQNAAGVKSEARTLPNSTWNKTGTFLGQMLCVDNRGIARRSLSRRLRPAYRVVSSAPAMSDN